MSAIRMLFSWLTEKGILAMNPAREVKTEKFSRTEGKTPAFDTEQVQKVLDKIDTSNEVGLRDRALLGSQCLHFCADRSGREPQGRASGRYRTSYYFSYHKVLLICVNRS